VRATLPLGEASLSEDAPAAQSRIGEWSAVLVGFSALVAAFTWPQVRHLDSVPDLGDPLFSIWRISWINHQVPHNPVALFDANIFHPERLTFTYSDPVLVPGLMSAPLFWLGLHRVHIYNLLLLSAFVLSGLTMYLLSRALTGRRDAALVAGVVFTLYPYRLEHPAPTSSCNGCAPLRSGRCITLARRSWDVSRAWPRARCCRPCGAFFTPAA
jgi:hypothetical protein